MMTQTLTIRGSIKRDSCMILLVTNKEDLTADYFIQRAVERGLDIFRFNTEDLLTQFDVTISLDAYVHTFSIWDRARKIKLNLEDITAAYFRKPLPPHLAGETDKAKAEFEQRELCETLRSLWRLIPQSTWLNSPDALWSAGNKVKQLCLARKIGFQIPDTIISTENLTNLQFIREHNSEVISKAVRHGFLNFEDSCFLVFTNKLNSLDVSAIETSATMLPSIIQPCLDKLYDLRVTLIGKRIYAAALLSQSHVDTQIDWRTWKTVSSAELEHRPVQLPEVIAEKCLTLAQELGLKFGCIDMVLTKGGEYIFLEINPNGEWAWIEAYLKYPIRDAIIDTLLGE